jgi:hypothetical protein
MIPPKYLVIFNLLLTLTVNNLSIPLQLHHVKKVYIDWQKHLKKQRTQHDSCCVSVAAPSFIRFNSYLLS